jgi:hypothetical protein
MSLALELVTEYVPCMITEIAFTADAYIEPDYAGYTDGYKVKYTID